MRYCFFISNQPKEFPWEYGKNPKAHEEYTKQLNEAIAVAVEMDEITTFCCGLTHSVDLDFAEAVLHQKSKHPNIKLICIVDTEQASDHWNEQDAERCKSILTRADEKQPLPDVPPIDNAEQVIAVWNGQESGAMWDVLYYTMQQSKSVYFIRLNDIKEDTDEPNGKLKRELREAEEASKRSVFTRIADMLLIRELIAGHPNPKSAFKSAIEKNPAFAKEIAHLAEIMELDTKK